MSLLEDVFLENEAGEAQELERVIEGDDFDERPRSPSDSDENSAKEDEAEEEKTRVDPTNAKPKRVIKNPRFVLNPARLTGPRGIQVVTEHFKDFKFKGKGHEKEDLDLVLKKLEHWAYRLYPKFQFEDCLKKIETLGKKRAVAVHLHRIRMDQISSEETVVQKDSSDDEETPAQEPEEDEFDKLLQQQIEIARTTPAPNSVKKTLFHERSSIMPKATSSPSINDEQRERMLKNRRMAEERRLAKLKHNTSQENRIENGVSEPETIINDVSTEKKQNSAIDSSDEDVTVISKNVTNDLNKNDTIELDIDGTVLPKSYVPAKKYKTNDNSDGAMNSNATIDIRDSNNTIVELDDDGKVINPKRFNKSVIHSSDDDDDDDQNAVVTNKTVAVDKPEDTRTIITKIIQNKSDENLIINESSDVVNLHDELAKNHTRSIIDSSDSEDEAVVMNESISVDIHDSNKHINDCNKSDKNVTNVCNNTNTKNDDLKATNSETYNDVLMECIKDVEELTDDLGLINKSSNDGKDNNSSKLNDNSTKELIAENDTNKSIETQVTDKNDTTKDHTIELYDDNDIMDVDFSDDF